MRYVLPPTCNVGDRLKVELSVTDVSRVYPFESKFIVEVEPEAVPAPPGPPPPPPGATLTGDLHIVEVRRDEWARYNFDEQSALELKYGDDDTLDIYINMDNINLRNEIARRRNMDPELLRYWFKYGLCLLALGILYQQRQSGQHDARDAEQEDAEQEDTGQKTTEHLESIADASRGLAVTVIPVIAQLGQKLAQVKG